MEAATCGQVGLSVPAAADVVPRSDGAVSTGWGEGGAGIFSLSFLNPLPGVPRQLVCCGTLKRVLSPTTDPVAQGYCVGFHYDENKGLAVLLRKELQEIELQETRCTELGTAAHICSGSCYK